MAREAGMRSVPFAWNASSAEHGHVTANRGSPTMTGDFPVWIAQALPSPGEALIRRVNKPNGTSRLAHARVVDAWSLHVLKDEGSSMVARSRLPRQ